MGKKGWWDRTVEAGLAATAEALYPANTLGAPDWQQVQMVPRTLAWWSELPARQRNQFRLLFGVVELLAAWLSGKPRRFSRLQPEQRQEIVRRWRASRLLPLKLIADSLKASTSMMYLSHPDALAYIGLYKAVHRPDDPFQVEIRSNALEEEE